jgi:hypothetical protein
MSKQEAASKYEELNSEMCRQMSRLSRAVDARDLVEVELADNALQDVLAEMRATLRLM